MELEEINADPRRIVPAHPADYQAVHNLRRATEAQVLPVLDELLQGLQSGSRPIASGIGEVLAQHWPAIRPAVLRILRGAAAQRSSLVLGLIVGRLPRRHLDAELVQELRRMARQPTPAERTEKTHERAQQLLDQLGL
jgi:Domain of unknown function (DUF5071)